MSDTKQLAFSAAQIDAILAAAQRCSNRNLLDNWYFANPVDQRGGYVVPPGANYREITSPQAIIGQTDKYYTATLDEYDNAHIFVDGVERWVSAVDGIHAVRGYTSDGYTIDRWKMWIDVGTILIETDGILLDATDSAITWCQVAESPLISAIAGKTVTMSILYTAVTDLTPATAIMVNTSDGVVNHVRLGTNAGVTDCRSGTFTLPSNTTFPCWVYVAKGQKIKIHAIKLELGSQQTLAHQGANGNWVLNDPPPDKNMELLKCQRYYQLYSSADKRPVKTVDCRPTMRVDPVQGTIVIDGTTYYYNSAEL